MRSSLATAGTEHLALGSKRSLAMANGSTTLQADLFQARQRAKIEASAYN
jgi:hypothetical protein